MLIAAMEAVHPNFWGGVFATLASVLGAGIIVMLLFDWDNPAKNQQDRDRDILKGPLG